MFAVAVTLLVVWGLLDMALTVLRVVSVSFPLLMGHIGFVLMFSRRFTIGDWVLVGDHEGVVTDITIMNTRLKSFDGESITIPNDVVSNQPITNRTEQGWDRTKCTAYSI